MKLSKECRHALSALTYLAQQPRGAIVEAGDLAEALAIPSAFLSKILQRLAGVGIVAGHRGAVRGYSLGRAACAISVRDVAEALDGADVLSRCIFWSEPCSDEKPCALHFEWARARPKIHKSLTELTIGKLASRATKAALVSGP